EIRPSKRPSTSACRSSSSSFSGTADLHAHGNENRRAHLVWQGSQNIATHLGRIVAELLGEPGHLVQRINSRFEHAFLGQVQVEFTDPCLWGSQAPHVEEPLPDPWIWKEIIREIRHSPGDCRDISPHFRYPPGWSRILIDRGKGQDKPAPPRGKQSPRSGLSRTVSEKLHKPIDVLPA